MWNSALWKTLSGKWKDESQAGRKYLQNTYVIKDFYLESTKNFLELSKNKNRQSSKKEERGEWGKRYFSEDDVLMESKNRKRFQYH